MGFLDRIVPEVERSIRQEGYGRDLPASQSVARPSLCRAVERANGALLVEFKRRSPGSELPTPHRPTVAQFTEWADGHAQGFSCIATGPEFHGSPADVAELAGCVDRPVLFKDFTVDPAQVAAAARTGAAAILLIARLEREGRLRWPLADLSERAHRHGLEVVLEFHDPRDLKVVEEVPADAYAVNVRDLDTLRLERSVADRTLRAAEPLHPLLGFSGISGPAEVRWFRERGTDGVLVGNALTHAADPSRLIAELAHAVRGVGS